MTNYYIAYQVNGPIFGIGDSAEKALTDAAQWTEDTTTLETGKCTKELFELVGRKSGDTVYGRNSEGLLDVAAD